MNGLFKMAHGNAQLELREARQRPAGPGEVVIRVRYAGICGTDLHIVKDEFPSWPPVILGHEFTGTVDSLGAGVDPALLGARVVCEPHASACQTCYLCRRGNPELCASKRSPGWGVDGAFASYVTVPAWLLHRVPDGIPDKVAVLAEPTAIVMTALRRADLAAGDAVLVVGPGPVGILAALAARTSGAADVVIAGGPMDGSRLEFARSLDLFAVASDDAPALMRERTHGRGADLVVECSGSAAGVATVFDAVRRRGRVASIGLSGQATIDVPWDLATSRAVDLAFSMSSNYAAWDAGLAILSRIASDAVRIPAIFPLGEWRAAFDAAASRNVIKAVLDPTEATDPR